MLSRIKPALPKIAKPVKLEIKIGFRPTLSIRIPAIGAKIAIQMAGVANIVLTRNSALGKCEKAFAMGGRAGTIVMFAMTAIVLPTRIV